MPSRIGHFAKRPGAREYKVRQLIDAQLPVKTFNAFLTASEALPQTDELYGVAEDVTDGTRSRARSRPTAGAW